MKKRFKKGQVVFGMSFGMIFSIILIIIFVAVAFYAIKIFLNMKNCGQVAVLKQDLENEVNRAWNSQETSSVFEGFVPGKIEKVCFIDIESSYKGKGKEIQKEFGRYNLKNMNVVFVPLRGVCEIGFEIKHLKIDSITSKNNPYCFDVEKGKIQINIDKGFFDDGVCVGDDCELEESPVPEG